MKRTKEFFAFIRKRWMWITFSVLLVLILVGLEMQGRSVKKGKSVENQIAQSETMVDSASRANVNQNLFLMKTYLLQNRPEMALVVQDDIESDIELLDSWQIADFMQMKESLCDSILTSTVTLVNITDVEEQKPHDYATLLKNCEVVDIQYVGDEDVLYIHDKEKDKTDTLIGAPYLNLIINNGITYLATYVHGDSSENDGIRIYSLQTGKIERFVGCRASSSWSSYPMGLSNDGKSLIYHEGCRLYDKTWFMDFENQRQVPLQTSYSCSCEHAVSSFSPNDDLFYLFFPEKKKIDVYSTRSLDVIHTFRYENCDSVYWDSSDNICVLSGGNVYSWRLTGPKKNLIFNFDSFANGVDISNRYAAVAFDDGKIYVWDFHLGKIIFAEEIMDAPQDVAISRDETQLWVISGYNCVKSIDLKSKKVESVYTEDKEVGPTHPWTAYLYMTKDGKYCISQCYYADQYSLFDLKGNVIKKGIQFDEYIKRYPDDILAEFVLPELRKRMSPDGKMCIEGDADGLIRMFSMQERNTVRTLIMRGNNRVTNN